MPKTLKIGRISCQICIFSKSDQQDGTVKNNDTLPQTKSRKNLDLGNFDYVFKGNQKANINKKNQNNNMLNKFAIFVVSCEKIFICTLKP